MNQNYKLNTLDPKIWRSESPRNDLVCLLKSLPDQNQSFWSLPTKKLSRGCCCGVNKQKKIQKGLECFPNKHLKERRVPKEVDVSRSCQDVALSLQNIWWIGRWNGENQKLGLDVFTQLRRICSWDWPAEVWGRFFQVSGDLHVEWWRTLYFLGRVT